MPLRGVPGKDFFIEYYPDHDTTKGIKDIFCGSKTYDGHRGTDMLLSGYKSMDTGVLIYAAADGIVFQAKDGNYDRNKHWTGGGLGNYVGIIHKNGICSYYGHMMKNSVMVKTGDTVREGQPIGKAGSSGYSCYPHLHFEVRDSDQHVIDPFSGSCSANQISYWKSQPVYDTSTYAISTGFVPYVPDLDTLQEGYLVSDTFYLSKYKTVCFWALMQGLRKGDILRAEWYAPDNKLHHKFSYTWKNAWWYDYTWTYINMPEDKGKWTLKLLVNDKFIVSRNFYVMKMQ